MELIKQLLALQLNESVVEVQKMYVVKSNFVASAHNAGRLNAGHQEGDIVKVTRIEDNIVEFLSDNDEDMDGDENRPVYVTSLKKFKTKVTAMNESVDDSPPDGLTESADVPKVGDECKADPIEQGNYIYGKITKVDVEGGLAWAELEGDDNEFNDEEFCGDLPTRKVDGVWIFDGF